MVLMDRRIASGKPRSEKRTASGVSASFIAGSVEIPGVGTGLSSTARDSVSTTDQRVAPHLHAWLRYLRGLYINTGRTKPGIIRAKRYGIHMSQRFTFG